MAVFEQENYGKVISQQLGNYIIYNIKKNDIEEISKQHNFLPSELTKIIRGWENLTRENSSMVQQLFKRCINNYMKADNTTKAMLNDLMDNNND
jgi:hypothetical protein